jgi:Ca2+/Na+ antiporter
MLDWVALVGSAVIMFVFGGTGRKITRTEGVVMLGLYLLYMVALVMGWQINVTF